MAGLTHMTAGRLMGASSWSQRHSGRGDGCAYHASRPAGAVRRLRSRCQEARGLTRSGRTGKLLHMGVARGTFREAWTIFICNLLVAFSLIFAVGITAILVVNTVHFARTGGRGELVTMWLAAPLF